VVRVIDVAVDVEEVVPGTIEPLKSLPKYSKPDLICNSKKPTPFSKYPSKNPLY
jgi:hypothetical protein